MNISIIFFFSFFSFVLFDRFPDTPVVLRRVQIPFVRSGAVPGAGHAVHAHLRTGTVRPGRRVRRTAVRALVRQEAETAVRQEPVGRVQGRHAAGAEHPDHRQVRVRRATSVAGHETGDGHGRVRRQPPGLRRRRPVRQPVRRDHIVPGVLGRPGGRARGLGVRLEQQASRRQVPSPPAGRPVGEYEHTSRPDGQHVQAVRFGVRETILAARYGGG